MAVALPITLITKQPTKALPKERNFFIRSNNKLNRLRLKDILWVHADGNYCYIKTVGKKYAVKISMRRLAAKLPPQEFTRIHKSYLIRTECIDGINIQENTVFIGQQKLPIGRVYKVELFGKLDVL